MPKHNLETVYMYMRFVDSQTGSMDSDFAEKREDASIGRKQKGFQGLMSFAGTLPEDFEYEKELEEAREAKYAHIT